MSNRAMHRNAESRPKSCGATFGAAFGSLAEKSSASGDRWRSTKENTNFIDTYCTDEDLS
ncbi:MAG: hypothetical protein HQM08_29915 [Candidatus Riflebacteria bacterium]|nr:hypothetical protein [Candidatus Riflebacteria bacterium]